jgi:hypothetical protein
MFDEIMKRKGLEGLPDNVSIPRRQKNYEKLQSGFRIPVEIRAENLQNTKTVLEPYC